MFHPFSLVRVGGKASSTSLEATTNHENTNDPRSVSRDEPLAIDDAPVEEDDSMGDDDTAAKELQVDDDDDDSEDQFIDSLEPTDYTLFGPMDTSTIAYTCFQRFLRTHAAEYAQVDLPERRWTLLQKWIQTDLASMEQKKKKKPMRFVEQDAPTRRYRVLTNERDITSKIDLELREYYHNNNDNSNTDQDIGEGCNKNNNQDSNGSGSSSDKNTVNSDVPRNKEPNKTTNGQSGNQSQMAGAASDKRKKNAVNEARHNINKTNKNNAENDADTAATIEQIIHVMNGDEHKDIVPAAPAQERQQGNLPLQPQQKQKEQPVSEPARASFPKDSSQNKSDHGSPNKKKKDKPAAFSKSVILIDKLLSTDVVAGKCRSPGNLRYKQYLASFIQAYPEPTWENAKIAHAGFDGRFLERVKDDGDSTKVLYRSQTDAQITMKFYQALRNWKGPRPTNTPRNTTSNETEDSNDHTCESPELQSMSGTDTVVGYNTKEQSTVKPSSSIEKKKTKRGRKKATSSEFSSVKPSTKVPTKEKMDTIETPEPDDVVFGKGMPNHPGNLKFAALVQEALPLFVELTRRDDPEAFCRNLLEDFSLRFLVFQNPGSHKELETSDERIEKLHCILKEEFFDPGSFLRPYKKHLKCRKQYEGNNEARSSTTEQEPTRADQPLDKKRKRSSQEKPRTKDPLRPVPPSGNGIPSSALQHSTNRDSTTNTTRALKKKSRRPDSSTPPCRNKKAKIVSYPSTSVPREPSRVLTKVESASSTQPVQPEPVMSMVPDQTDVPKEDATMKQLRIKGLLLTINRNMQRLPLIQRCFELLLEAVSEDDLYREETCRRGGVPIIVSAMQLYNQCKPIQLLTLRILLNLMSGPSNMPDGEKVAVDLESGGGEDAIFILKKHFPLEKGNRDILILRDQILEKLHGLLKEQKTKILIHDELAGC